MDELKRRFAEILGIPESSFEKPETTVDELLDILLGVDDDE